MTDSNKKEIALLLEQFIAQFPSQAQACAQLKNVSEATVIQMRKGRWESINDNMWRNVGKQVGWDNKGSWSLAETLDFKTLVAYLADAKDYGNVHGIVGQSGSGKTAVSEWFSKVKPNVYHLECAEYMTPKIFLRKLLAKMGKENAGYNVADMMDIMIELLLKQDKPLIILDEFDKLHEKAKYFFITLYNMLEGKCGIVIMATDVLRKKVLHGVKYEKIGYPEIFSRIGRRFIQLSGSTKDEVREICQANGIENPMEVAEIYNDYDGDLRRVKKMVHKMRLRKETTNAA